MKKNNSLLMTILGGAVFCFVFLSIAFIFTNGTKTFRSNNNALPNNQIVNNNDEITLGDSSGCIDWNYRYSCSSGNLVGTRCYQSSYSAAPGTCPSGWSYSNGQCHDATGTAATATKTTCKECDDEYTLKDGSCILDPVITCLNPTYTGESITIARCQNGSITSGEKATDVGSHVVSCRGSKLVSKSCSILPRDPVITCLNPKYTGEPVTIAKCDYGSITSGGKATDVGSHVVSCQGSKLVSKSCSVVARDPVITCLNPRYTGSSQTIAKCEYGTIISGGTATDIGSNHTVSCQGSKLVSKDCSIIGNEGTVCCCTKDKAMCSWMKACTYSQPSPVQGVSDEMNCKAQENGDIPNDCTVSVSIRSKATSVTSDGTVDTNSYYTVTVSIKGKSCGGQTVSYSASNGRPSPSSYSVPVGSVSSTVSFNVYPSDPCQDSCATATINGKSSTACLGSDDSIRTDWKPITENICEKNPQYTAFYLADEADANIYYSNWDESKGCYTTQWKRNLCGRGGTPASSTTPETPHCYVDNDGEYHWVINPANSWKLVDTITKESNCQKDEKDACYKKPNGEYVWGKHAKDDGYVLITAIKNSDSCKTPTDEACYKKDNDYKWVSEAPEGYTKVDGVNEPKDCAPDETPGCYLHGNKFIWGKYAKVSGYIFIENIEEEKYCKTPDTDACYKDSKGDYVWGKYGDTEGYTLVPSVTEMSQCNNNVPTPKTDISVSKIVYIFMAILMAFGVGFIYYSSTIKKTN